MWMRLKGHGKMIRLDLGTGDDEEFLARVLTGDRRSARQKTLPELYAATKAKSPHDVWMVEAGSGLSSMTVTAPAGLVKLSYDALQPIGPFDERSRQAAQDSRHSRVPGSLAAN
jgi:hypothetical protein